MSLMQMLLASVAAGTSSSWSPLSLSPALWLDASNLASLTIGGSNNISQWNDLSGNSRHVSQGSLALQPTLSGEKVVFAGGQSLQQASYDITGLDNITIYLVATPSATPIQSIIRFQDAPNPYFAYPWAPTIGSNRMISHTDGGTGGPSAGFTTGGVNIGVGQRERNNATGLRTWMNGTLVGQTATANTTINAGPLSIGSWNGAGEFYTGSVLETFVVHGVSSASDREKAEGYLAWKWGAQGSLPVGHPFKNAPP